MIIEIMLEALYRWLLEASEKSVHDLISTTEYVEMRVTEKKKKRINIYTLKIIRKKPISP